LAGIALLLVVPPPVCVTWQPIDSSMPRPVRLVSLRPDDGTGGSQDVQRKLHWAGAAEDDGNGDDGDAASSTSRFSRRNSSRTEAAAATSARPQRGGWSWRTHRGREPEADETPGEASVLPLPSHPVPSQPAGLVATLLNLLMWWLLTSCVVCVLTLGVLVDGALLVSAVEGVGVCAPPWLARALLRGITFLRGVARPHWGLVRWGRAAAARAAAYTALSGTAAAAGALRTAWLWAQQLLGACAGAWGVSRPTGGHRPERSPEAAARVCRRLQMVDCSQPDGATIVCADECSGVQTAAQIPDNSLAATTAQWPASLPELPPLTPAETWAGLSWLTFWLAAVLLLWGLFTATLRYTHTLSVCAASTHARSCCDAMRRPHVMAVTPVQFVTALHAQIVTALQKLLEGAGQREDGDRGINTPSGKEWEGVGG
jgi:hypothetical protein